MPIPIDLSHIDWTLVVEQRTRLERRIDPDFSNAIGDNQTRLDNRFRIGYDFKAGKSVSGQLRYQYSHSIFWKPTLNNSDDASDLLLANVSLKDHQDTWTLGRQFVTKGAKRLIDVSDYSQRPKVFEVLRYKNSKWDAFAGRIAMTSNIKDHSTVAMTSYQWGTPGETMAIYHKDEKSNLNSYTLDHRWVQDYGKANVELEGAYQKGRVSGADLDAFWAHARVQFAESKSTTWYAEANVASGGAGKGKTHLFDPLYGTGHAPYGLMDLQGLRNLRHLELGVQQKFTKTLSGLASLNGYGLYDPSDGWYNTGGSINKRPGGSLKDATGKSGRDVGREWNLALTFIPNKHDTFSLEFGVFQPGNFVRKLIGNPATNQVWGLLSYTAKF